MRVVIYSDMEGVAGITNWSFVDGGAPFYEEGRKLYTGEINAAVRGCKRAGATEIWAVDGHGAGGDYSFRSLVPERLEPGARYVLGYPWARFVEPLRDGSCDAALFIGAHAMAGIPDGGMSHTVSSQAWYNAWINGALVGESGILAAICGDFGVPVAFVSGDEATCREVRALLGEEVGVAPVKRSLHRFAADTLCHQEACSLIEEGVASALSVKRFPRAWKVAAPVEFKVQLASTEKGDNFINRRGVELVEDRVIVSRGGSFWEAWDQFWPGLAMR